MPQICLYLHLHQPLRLAPFEVFDLDHERSYFATADQDDNKQIFLKVADKSYRPMLTLLEELIHHEPEFCFALSITGVFIEQLRWYTPDILEQLKRLIATGRVEVLAETYYHSLASLYSEPEFNRQVQQHLDTIKAEFGVTPTTFRNTELVYSNHIAWLVHQLGFDGVLTEGVDRYLGGRPRTQVYASWGEHQVPVLLKHAQLSDDIAFRFSDKSWSHHPLHSQTYLDWIQSYKQEEVINLFMDFETFGEHQWADTGIFNFFRQFVHDFIRGQYNQFVLPHQLLRPASNVLREKKKQEEGFRQNSEEDLRLESDLNANHVDQHPNGLVENFNLPVYDVPEPISWADVDRDLTAWVDNAYQRDTLRLIYQIESAVMNSGNQFLIDEWGKLQTSDHFYYMCTKWAADGDVHAYFSPYDSPHEAYRRYSTVLADFMQKVGAI